MKPQKPRKPRFGGHRGLPLSFPDNTLEGITAAAAAVDFVELDVRCSADGRLVLSHDPAFGEIGISDHSWAELSTIDLGGGYRPTLLDAVLDALPDTPLDIEIKNSPVQPGFDPDSRFAVDVAALARPIDFLSSFFWPTIDTVKAAHPEVRTGLLVDGLGSLSDTIAVAISGGHEVIAPHFTLLVEAPGPMIETAHAAGLEVVGWTVNDPAVAVCLAAAGIDAIISDDPVRIRQEMQ